MSISTVIPSAMSSGTGTPNWREFADARPEAFTGPMTASEAAAGRGQDLLLDETQWKPEEFAAYVGSGVCRHNRVLVILRMPVQEAFSVRCCIRAGARCVGTDRDSCDEQDVIAASLLSDRLCVSSHVLEAWVKRVPPTVLTQRQKEVLQLVAEGASSGEVARALFIQKSTVDWHIKSIQMALDSPTRAAAVYRAACLGLL